MAFLSRATNLLNADTDDFNDVYVRELEGGSLRLASTSDSGEKGNNHSLFAPPRDFLSQGGRRVAFNALSTNLDSSDLDNGSDTYVKDQAGELFLASVSLGIKGNSSSQSVTISSDGSTVAFDSHVTNLHPADTDPNQDVYVKILPPPASFDGQPPTMTIAAPPSGGTYVVGQTATVDFFCGDEPGGSGLASCQGSQPDGATLDTSTTGNHQFTVTAKDNAGNVATGVRTPTSWWTTPAPTPTVTACFDEWEQNGIDADGNGTDRPCASISRRSTPTRRRGQDIFLEVEATGPARPPGCPAGHVGSTPTVPPDGTLADVVAAFAADAYPSNPDGKHRHPPARRCLRAFG